MSLRPTGRVLCLLALLLLATACSGMQGAGDTGYVTGAGQITQLTSTERDEPINFVGEDLDGKPLSLADLRGNAVVVVVWYSTCPPCRAEAPEVNAAVRELGDEAEFVGVNIRDSSPAQAQSFVRTFEVPFPSFYSPDGKAMLAFSDTLTPNSVPNFTVLDRRGRVAATILGQLPSTTTLVQLVRDVHEPA